MDTKHIFNQGKYLYIKECARRVIQALVILPASTVGVIVFVLAITGNQPIHSLVTGIFEYSDEHIRPAKPGYVLSRECIKPVATVTGDNTIPLPEVKCKTNMIEIPVAQVVDDTVSVIVNVYFVLVLISFAALVVKYPGRQFYMAYKQKNLNK